MCFHEAVKRLCRRGSVVGWSLLALLASSWAAKLEADQRWTEDDFHRKIQHATPYVVVAGSDRG